MILTIEEARDAVALDDDLNDSILISLLETIPDYLEVTAGYKPVRGKYSPLAKTVAIFLLRLWFEEPDRYSDKLQRTIDNLLTALSVSTVKGRR